MKNFIESLYELEKECFEKEAWSKGQIESHLNNGKVFTLGEKEIYSYVFYYESLEFIEILRIGTKKEFRRRGIATQILSYIINLNKPILLEVHEENLAARKLYGKFGFSEISVRKKYYSDGKSAIVMRYSPVYNNFSK